MRNALPEKRPFDDWPDRYEAWFATPVGRLVWRYERALLLELLAPCRGDAILDAGCGTGLFTQDLLAAGARVTGLDISRPMLRRAAETCGVEDFSAVLADMADIPFPADAFDRVVSVTALEFLPRAERAVAELFRVARPGGRVVVATLNRISPWAVRREAEARTHEDSLFRGATFRSPEELLALAPVSGAASTCVHFSDRADPARIPALEAAGRKRAPGTGAFVAAAWTKPGRCA